LISRGTTEPYRMFTSRAEFRLSLREDNADLRLTPIGRELGLVVDARWNAFEARREWLATEAQRLRGIFVRPTDVPADGAIEPLAREVSGYDLLRRPGIGYADVAALARVGPAAALAALDTEAAEQWARSLEIEAHYAGYVERQSGEIERQKRQTDVQLPADLDYAAVTGLSNELREKLVRIRPNDIGQAARISGMTPAAISLLLIHVKKRQRRSA
jgi:tRNA uridine 5-carboxymethylaminomethyl modification enzyme